ncbi:GNAT family N-acetyltransferase [Enterococcus raffinosus]|uniref:GNAT family N-acetyltransferase n=1 Tax=Enterococcus raffinosus TaxID=71452 RepID=UPI001C10F797|nr:GNAT family N-acetyltransferase [Enterococcus raffinosus]MBU5360634.1 GNAT family N-acetyltransferase [Enterococcus raffinosus]
MKEIFGASPELQAAAFYLRYQVFVLEQNILAELEFDQLDTVDRQYLVFFDEQLPIATVRYQKIDESTLNPDRLCVHPDYRNQGLGRKLLDRIELQARQEGCQYSVLSAELSAQSFYEKIGYRVVSDIFEEDGIPCVKMQKELVSD